jgi:tetratricopeptide (TPR) repeat protein
LALAPGNARALYYRALVERNLGNMDMAIADLQKVVASFPRSRDAHRELGFSYYQFHKYEEARVEYEKVQSIDPDDLSAHYVLSIVYRRLGLLDLSQQQAAIFADQKDDPTASTYAFEFLSKHTEIANEGIVWHTHELDMPLKPGKRPLQIIAPSTSNMSGGEF